MPAKRDSLTFNCMGKFALSLVGLWASVFAMAALTGPGRIDIVDGQTRFEVSQSLIDDGDSAVRDPRIWWGRFPGRDGLDFTYYRFPHSVLGAGAVWLADATGPVSEGRRHFFFTMVGPFCCGLLAVLYAVWFRRIGLSPPASLLWGAGGIFCTPNWYYGTSTFDEFLCSTVIIAALVTACGGRGRHVGWAVGAGLLFGLAFNCKQPLAAFALMGIALLDDRSRSRRYRLLSAWLIAAGVLVGIAVEQGYDRMKFPFDKKIVHAELYKLYGENFANHQLAAIACVTVSLGAGAIWYFPPIFLTLAGLRVWWHFERRIVLAFLLASLPFLGFFLSFSFFKGDPAWGPRYLTPWFAILWLFAPAGAAKLSPFIVKLLLAAGVVVQALALSVDPHRLYVERDASSGFGRVLPWLYFQPGISHIWNRPREIIEIAGATPPPEYTPAPSPTFTFPILDPPYLPERGRGVVERYRVLNGYRPFWLSMTTLPVDERPVNLGKAVGVLLMTLGCGLLLLAPATRRN